MIESYFEKFKNWVKMNNNEIIKKFWEIVKQDNVKKLAEKIIEEKFLRI